MTETARIELPNYNPDVLTCIANLSNDEVFTPPGLANQMLDTLADAWSDANGGASLWSSSSTKFLDPFTKSGVFLREITSRLVDGLADEIPDLEKRVEHVLTKQVFGIAITQLTGLIARRSVYCSKFANGKHSLVKSFTTDSGNIWFEPVEHSWVGATKFVETADKKGKPVRKGIDGRCEHCGASQKVLERGEGAETHAYAFIHAADASATIANIFGEQMEFDVIIGNPPYQLADGGSGGSAVPIYHKFVEQAKALNPRLLTMVTPSRWFVGGRGLDAFRATMLEDRRMRVIVDYVRDKDAFPNVNVNGGVNYFLWDRDNSGDCAVTTVAPGGAPGPTVVRPLNEFDLFVRRNEAVPILRKVRAKAEPTFDARVSSLKPFGLRTHFHGAPKMSAAKPVKLYGSGAVTWVSKNEIVANVGWVDRWKVLVARATDGNENYPLPIWDASGPFVARPGEACSETYLVAALTKSQLEAQRVVMYMQTQFFRFLVSLRKMTQDNKAQNFSFVPDLPMDRVWTDELLYARYGITKDEVSFIDEMIRRMDFGNA